MKKTTSTLADFTCVDAGIVHRPILRTIIDTATGIVLDAKVVHGPDYRSSIVGPAGTGKTTALRRYAEENPNGSILIGGQS